MLYSAVELWCTSQAIQRVNTLQIKPGGLQAIQFVNTIPLCIRSIFINRATTINSQVYYDCITEKCSDFLCW